MKKGNLVLFMLMIIGLIGRTQVIFKHGSFIDENNQRIECFIKDMDWLNNPSGFEYKLSEDSEIIKADILDIKEFEIYNTSKHVRALVQIDRSGSEVKDLTANRNPHFAEELLFLKVLVEGKATLYQYRESSLSRFFYKTDDQEIRQLIFKYFLTGKNQVARNEFYKQQLYSDLECPAYSKKDFERINYTNRDLSKLFVSYNVCVDANFVDYNEKKENNRFLISIRPGLNYNSLSITHASDFMYGKNKFPSGINFRFGIELEYILPFYANKWSLFIEPTYRNQKWEDNWEARMAGGLLIANVDYQSLELPLGIRYYHHLSNNSKVFANGTYIKDFPFNSTFDQVRTNGELYRSRQLRSGGNFALGAGYKYNDQFIMEIRYQTARQILNRYANWNSEFRTVSMVFGYTLF